MKNQNLFISKIFRKTLALACLLFCAQGRASVCGQLAAVKGTGVEVLRLQSGRTTGDEVRYGVRAEENKILPIECDDVILTGRDSSTKIILADTKLSLGPDSRLEIASYTKGSGTGEPAVSLLSLTYGKMRALFRRKGGESVGKKGEPQSSNFHVRTATAVVGVRGTDFYTGYDLNSGLTEQATIEGQVEVARAGSTQTVLVSAGQQVSVDAPAPKAGALAAIALKVVPLQDSVRNAARMVSAVVKDDKDFTYAGAVETLGKPDTWTMEREPVPDKLKNLKDEF